jgi:hypothetical protein
MAIQNNHTDSKLEKLINDAAKFSQWVFPEKMEDVLIAEKTIDESKIELPKNLLNPYKLLKDPKMKFHMEKQFCSSQLMEENLARAAREGGTIPQHVLDRMRKDRSDVERKLDK